MGKAYVMNSLHLYYLKLKDTNESAKSDKYYNVVMKVKLAMPKSTALKNSIIEAYRSKRYNRGGYKKRPVVPLTMG